MICPRCDGSGTTSPEDVLDAEDCSLCDGSGEAPAVMRCGHPTQCYRQHGEHGSSCAWCLDLMESVSARCRRTGYQACLRCDDLDCGDNTSDAAVIVRRLRTERDGARREVEQLRAEVARLRARLAAETGGEVDGWKWAETRGEYYWTWQGCASEWCVRVFSNRAGWWWQIEGPGDIINTDAYMRQDVLDAMRAAVAAYERLRGEEDGGDA